MAGRKSSQSKKQIKAMLSGGMDNVKIRQEMLDAGGGDGAGREASPNEIDEIIQELTERQKELDSRKKGWLSRQIARLPGFGALPPEDELDKVMTEGGMQPPGMAARPMGRGPGGGGPGAAFATRAKARDSRKVLMRLAEYLKQYKAASLLAISAIMLETLGNSIMPMIMGNAITAAAKSAGEQLADAFLIALAGYAILSALMPLLQAFYAWTLAGVSQKIVYIIRRGLFEQLQKLSLRYFDTREKGDLMSRLTNDVDTISYVVSHNASELVAGSVTLTVTLIVMFCYNWQLALVALLPVPLSVLLTKFVAAMSRRYYYQRSKALGSVNGFIEEIVTAQHVVSVFCREEEERQRFERRNERLKTLSIKSQALTGIMMPTVGMINNIGFAVLAAAGGLFVVNGWADVGMLAAFFVYARNFGRPISQLGQIFAQVQSALAGAERIFEIMDEEPEIRDSENARGQKLAGHVSFRDVSFSYVSGVPVLKNITLEARPGQTIALVGPTGAGKTTIVNLLTHFYDIDSGSIQIDGIDIRELSKDSLRSQLGIVLQDTYLFAESVMDNIRYGRLDATEQEIRDAAVMANADQFIRRLPDGYATVLSESGGNLSQGQRQLLAITRAMLADPAILVLDEATSSVDTRTEMHIQAAMLELMKGRTSFVIAHRLSTIQNADLILVINDGRIIERGTHSQLLAQGGFYHDLYHSQFAVQQATA